MARILVLDDQEDMLEVVAYNLERAGHEVVRARSAAAALAWLARGTPDLIISDIMMPGMDGIEFCEEIRRSEATALTPCLFLTAKSQEKEKRAGLQAGADDYITKPFELGDLLARVEGRLAHRARLRLLEDEMARAEHRWAEASD